jgi:hypothetical protein
VSGGQAPGRIRGGHVEGPGPGRFPTAARSRGQAWGVSRSGHVEGRGAGVSAAARSRGPAPGRVQSSHVEGPGPAESGGQVEGSGARYSQRSSRGARLSRVRSGQVEGPGPRPCPEWPCLGKAPDGVRSGQAEGSSPGGVRSGHVEGTAPARAKSGHIPARSLGPSPFADAAPACPSKTASRAAASWTRRLAVGRALRGDSTQRRHRRVQLCSLACFSGDPGVPWGQFGFRRRGHSAPPADTVRVDDVSPAGWTRRRVRLGWALPSRARARRSRARHGCWTTWPRSWSWPRGTAERRPATCATASSSRRRARMGRSPSRARGGLAPRRAGA